MVNINFKIKNNKNNQIISLNGTLNEDNNIVRGGQLIRCNCDLDNPVPYQYDALRDCVFCPKCNRRSVHVELSENMNDDVYLYYIGTDYNTMQDLYKLSVTLPYNSWLKVSEFFVKLNTFDVDLDYPLRYVGWVTSTPDKVELALDIPMEYWVSNRDVERELHERVHKDKDNHESKSIDTATDDYYFDIVDKLHEVFSVVETPYGRFDLSDGIVVQNPLFPQNKYGSGECFVVLEDEIWFVRNNYRHGDNLNFNNILLDGSLKAIGKVIQYDEDVVELICKLK